MAAVGSKYAIKSSTNGTLQNLDSGLDHRLDSGLNNGLDNWTKSRVNVTCILISGKAFVFRLQNLLTK